jgi:GNAT superfamily N-acetyltransferase
MRLFEITERINPESVDSSFKVEKDINDRFYLVARGHEESRGLLIYVYDREKDNSSPMSYIAFARLMVQNRKAPIDERYLSASFVYVSPEFQRRGLASAMYNFARELKNDILPSGSQTRDGKAFWSTGAGQGKSTMMPSFTPNPERKMEPKKPNWIDKALGMFRLTSAQK